MDNIAHLGGNPNFKFIQQDVTEFLFLDAPVNYVWHFASPASPIDYLELPIQTLKVGSLGTHKALGLAKEKGARFLLASTSEIYGDPLVHPQTEEYWGNVNTIGPRGCYDEAKRFAEALTMAYHREHKVETRIVRIFNTYGPRMRLNDGRVVPAFISQALKNKPVTVFGKGTADAQLLLRLRFDRRHLPADDERLRFAGEHRQSGRNDHARNSPRQIIRATKSRSKIVFKPLPQDDPKQRKPDITKAKKILELGAQSAAGRRPDGHHRLFPNESLNVMRSRCAIESRSIANRIVHQMLFRARQFEFTFPRPALVMGIVNVTPDSFSDGGKFLDPEAAVAHALELVAQGAEILDIGGESTRPGAEPVSEAEELRRVIPVIEKLAAQVKIPLSIDTMKPAVARAALQAGASIVNDVAANREADAMWRIVAEFRAGYICMHAQGTPQTMQKNPVYADVVREVGDFFSNGWKD